MTRYWIEFGSGVVFARCSDCGVLLSQVPVADADDAWLRRLHTHDCAGGGV